MMPANNPDTQPHPEELLGAFALDALDEGEAIQVETHLDGCRQCRQSVAALHGIAARLGRSVDLRQPAPALQSRLMGALDRVGAQAASARAAPSPAWSMPRVFRLLLPVAGAVAITLFALGVLMNLRLSDRTEGLARENSTLTVRVNDLSGRNSTLAADLAQIDAQESQVEDTLTQLQLTSYWLANPANHPLTLKPPGGTGDSRGVLLVGDGGRRALLMVSGISHSPAPATYHVWLMRQGTRLWVGELSVDARGWGALTLQPREPLFGFQKVELTAETVAGVAPGPADMVLEGAIESATPTQGLTPQQWP